MPNIPFFCDTCGTPFRSGLFLENVRATIGTMSAGPCPNCGGRGTLSNVVLNATEDAIRILFNGADAAARVEHLQALIERAQQGQTSPEELVAELEQGDTMWQQLGALLSRLLVPKDAGQFYGLLALLVAVLPLLYQPQQQPKKDELTPAKMAELVDAAVERAYERGQRNNSRASVKPAPAKLVASPKHTSRNAPCPCGSKTRYKNCCGRLTKH